MFWRRAKEIPITEIWSEDEMYLSCFVSQRLEKLYIEHYRDSVITVLKTKGFYLDALFAVLAFCTVRYQQLSLNPIL
jgi:hypothetical protein